MPDEPADQVVSLDPTRQSIARRLGKSYREAVHVTVVRKIDATSLLDAADTLSEAGRAGSLVDIVIIALSAALEEHERFNATFDGDELTIEGAHRFGIAVDTEAGLLAPVLEDVRHRSVEEIATERKELTERVQAGEQTMADLSDGTITVTNLGPLGVDLFTPIINPPQVAIVSLNRLTERLTLVDGEVVATEQLPIGVTFDHRVVDGADAARLLETLADRLADAPSLIEA